MLLYLHHLAAAFKPPIVSVRRLIPLLHGLCAPLLTAAPGDTDQTFEPGIYEGYVTDAIPLPDGRTLALGNFATVDGQPQAWLARLNPDGRLDNSFRPVLDGRVYASAILPNGKIVVAGDFRQVNGSARNRIALLNADGSLDSSFAASADGAVFCLQPESGGRILVGGDFTAINGENQGFLARLNFDGSRDASFAPVLDGSVQEISPDLHGGIFLAGTFKSVSGLARAGVALLSSGGLLSEAFAPAADGEIRCIVAQPDGGVLMAGTFTLINGTARNGIARLRADGALDPEYASAYDLTGPIYTLALQADGKALIGGKIYGGPAGNSRRGWARLTADGSLDTSLRPAWTPAIVYSIWPVAGNRVLAAGLDGVNSIYLNPVVEKTETDPASETLRPDSATTLKWQRGGASANLRSATFDLSTDGGVSWTYLGEGSKVNGGWELTGLSLPPKGTLRARGTPDCVGSGSHVQLETLANFGLSAPTPAPLIEVEGPDGAKLVAGQSYLPFGDYHRAATLTVRNIGTGPLRIHNVALSGFSSHDYLLDLSLTRTLLPPNHSTTLAISFDPYSDDYYSTASLSISSDVASTPSFGVNLRGLAYPDRIDILSLGVRLNWSSNTTSPPFHNYIKSYQISIPNNAIPEYLFFTSRSYSTTPSLSIDGGLPISDDTVWLTTTRAATQTLDLKFISPRSERTQTHQLTIRRTAPLPGDLDLGYDPRFGFSRNVTCAALLPHGQLLLGGTISPAEGQPARSLVRLNNDGSVDPGFSAPVSGLTGIAAQADGSIYVFASFSMRVNGVLRQLARLQANGEWDPTFCPAVNGVKCVLVREDRRLLIGGDFTEVNGEPVMRLAQLNPDGSLDKSFLPQPNGTVNCLALGPDGTVFVGGAFTSIGGIPKSYVARLSSKGEADPLFQATLPTSVRSLQLLPDGGLLAQSPGLHKLLPGSVQFSKITNAGESATPYVQQADGKILLTKDRDLVRLGSNELLDTSFNADREFAKNTNGDGLLQDESGKLYVMGLFSNWQGFEAKSVVRLHNSGAVTAAPSVASSNRVTWTQTGTAPMAWRVLLQISVDGGTVWQDAQYGRYKVNEWCFESVGLPSSGSVRVLAFVNSGGFYLGQGFFSSPPASFSFTPPEMAVWQPSGDLGNGVGTVDFGSVGLRGQSQVNISVRNTGGINLHLGPMKLAGAHASQFTVVSAPTSPIPPLTTAALKVAFAPSSLGTKSAFLRFSTNDADEPEFAVSLLGKGVPATGPAVKTLPAELLGATGALLKGTIDTRGANAVAYFDYGTTPSYGQTIELGSLSTPSPTEVTHAMISGLLPHTKYYYRLRAIGTNGSAAAAAAAFITANRAPNAKNHAARIFYVGTTTLPLLEGCTDPDGDLLKLLSIGAPNTGGRLRLVKSGNSVLISQLSSQRPPVVFSYTIGDSFGGTATGTVTIDAATSISARPSEVKVSAEAQSVVIQVDSVTSDTMWHARPYASWITAEPSAGRGSFSVGLYISANNSKLERASSVSIGSEMVRVTQAGITAKPVLEPPALVPVGRVNVAYSLVIPAQGELINYTATGLPPGLRMNPDTSTIDGRPTKPGKYHVTLRARNTAGAAAEVLGFDIVIDPLPEAAIGTFHGYLASSLPDDPLLRARIEVTTTSTGAASGKIISGGTTRAYRGQVYASNHTEPVLSLSIPASANTFSSLQATIDIANETATGSWKGAVVTLWRNPWHAVKNPAVFFAGAYSFYVKCPYDLGWLPQGYGFGSFTIDEKSGGYKMAGRLADGSAFLTSSFVGATGLTLVYQSLYQNSGSVGGVLTVSPKLFALGGSLVWHKPATVGSSQDRLYPGGFGPIAFTASGSYFAPQPAGGLFLGLLAKDLNAHLVCLYGGLDLEGRTVDLPCTVTNPKPTGLTNIATFQPNSPYSPKITTLDLKTGMFAGSFTIPAENGNAARTATFVGQTVWTYKGTAGYGHFLLPQPDGGPQPMLSGSVQMLSR